MKHNSLGDREVEIVGLDLHQFSLRVGLVDGHLGTARPGEHEACSVILLDSNVGRSAKACLSKTLIGLTTML